MKFTFISLDRSVRDKHLIPLERFGHHVSDEFWLRLRGSDTYIKSKDMHRLSIGLSNQTTRAHTALGVHMYPVDPVRLLDDEGLPSRQRMAEVICDALLSIADEQGLDKRRIRATFEAFDFSVPYYQERWLLKVQKSRKEFPQLAVVTRVDRNSAHVLAELSDEGTKRFCLLARTDVVLESWWNKLGYFVWRSSDQFCLMDRKKNMVACRHISDCVDTIEQLIQ